jgi:hypothetical protein
VYAPTKGESSGKLVAFVCSVHSLSKTAALKFFLGEITLQKSGEKLRQRFVEDHKFCE